MIFGQNWLFFHVFLMQYRSGKCVLRYATMKKRFFWALKARSSKSQKIEIFSKGLVHVFWPKLVFFHVFFKGDIGQKNVFYDILERNNVFLGFKRKKFKKSKK